MRIKTIFTLFISILLSLTTFSQEDENTKLDTIYLLGGRKKLLK